MKVGGSDVGRFSFGVFDVVTISLQGLYTLRGAQEAQQPDGTFAWELLVWSGVATGPDNGTIQITSPLFLSALTIALTYTGAPMVTLPLPPLDSRRVHGNMVIRKTSYKYLQATHSSRSMGDWLLVEGLRHMALKRLEFDQLGKTHDLQSHEWAVSCENQGSCLYSLLCLP